MSALFCRHVHPANPPNCNQTTTHNLCSANEAPNRNCRPPPRLYCQKRGFSRENSVTLCCHSFSAVWRVVQGLPLITFAPWIRQKNTTWLPIIGLLPPLSYSMSIRSQCCLDLALSYILFFFPVRIARKWHQIIDRYSWNPCLALVTAADRTAHATDLSHKSMCWFIWNRS